MIANPHGRFWLKAGDHKTRDDGMDLVELCAYLAGEPHSTNLNPRCMAVNELRKLAIRLCDLPWGSDDERTDALLPYAPALMVATATPEQSLAIRAKVMDITLRSVAPMILDIDGKRGDADRIARVHEVVDASGAGAFADEVDALVFGVEAKPSREDVATYAAGYIVAYLKAVTDQRKRELMLSSLSRAYLGAALALCGVRS